MDIVYTVKKNENNLELRYSLRSLSNLHHDRVWIVGSAPQWVTNVEVVRTNHLGSPWDVVNKNLKDVCAISEVSDEFIFFNDDFYVMSEMSNVPTLHNGLLSDLVAVYGRGQRNSYYNRIVNTSRQIGPRALNYELHVPMVFNKNKLHGYVSKKQNGLIRSIYGNSENIKGSSHRDVKFRHSKHPVPNPDKEFMMTSQFLSTSNSSFDKDFIGEFIRLSFPDKSIYEL